MPMISTLEASTWLQKRFCESVSEDLNAGQRIAGIRIENPFVRTKR